MAGEIVQRPASVLASAQIMGADQFDNAFRFAKALAASGQFKDISSAEQAFGRMLIGADMGLTPTQALMSIDVVRGNVQIRGKRLLAWVRQSENYDYDVVERTDERGAIQFFEKSKRTGEWRKVGPLKDPEDPDSERMPIAFTREEARDKGLISAQSAWDKWPANMCLWRCASIGVNLYCPDLTGGIPVYTEADSFESTATEIANGDGDGSEPGWHDVPEDAVAEIEFLLAEAERLELPGRMERATLQMRLNGQPLAAIGDWVAAARAQIEAVEPKDAEVVGEGEQQTLDGDES